MVGVQNFHRAVVGVSAAKAARFHSFFVLFDYESKALAGFLAG